MSSWIFGLSLSPWIKSSVFGCKSFPLLAILEQHIHSKRLHIKQEDIISIQIRVNTTSDIKISLYVTPLSGKTLARPLYQKSLKNNKRSLWQLIGTLHDVQKLAKIGVPYILILVVFTLVCNLSCFFHYNREK